MNTGLGFYNGENGVVFQDEATHIIENVERILTTRRGERIGDLSFGSDVQKYLFLPDLTIEDLVTEIKNSIARCEPRVTVQECSLRSTNEGEVNIDLILNLNNGNTVNTTVTL